MGTNFSTSDGLTTERDKLYYAERARGGAAMIIGHLQIADDVSVTAGTLVVSGTLASAVGVNGGGRLVGSSGTLNGRVAAYTGSAIAASVLGVCLVNGWRK